MRTALTIAGAALLLGGLVGCGGSDSEGGSDAASMPTNASTEEFCQNFADLKESLTNMDPDSEPSDIVSALQDASDNMAETGTPEGISEQERSGLEATIKATGDLSPDATLEEISNLESTLSADEKADAEAFNAYLSTTCPDLG